MKEGVIGLLPIFAAKLEIGAGIEVPVRVAPLERSLFEIMQQWVAIQLCDIGISRNIVFGVEQPRFGDYSIVVKKRGHEQS
jgi:hypothetical protein